MDMKPTEELQAFADAYHGDAAFRSEVHADPIGAFRDRGITFGDLPPRDFEVVANTEEVVHLVLPPDPNANLSDEALALVQGGSTASSAGSVGSLGTIACSTVPATFSSAGTASSAGSRG